MPVVQDVLAHKGSAVFTIPPSATVLTATRKMNRHKLGALVVVEQDHVVGMFTERDVLRRVVGEQRDPADTSVGEVMTEQVICCGPRMDLEEVAAIMREARVRHLPVCESQHVEEIGGLGTENGPADELPTTGSAGRLLGL